MVKDLEKGGFVYIISNWSGAVIYTGVTSDLLKRIYQHKNGLLKGFSQKYKVTKLVYYEEFGDIELAIMREKEIKKWRREKKNSLIKSMNPEWNDLAERWFEDSSSCAATVRNDGVVNGYE